MYKWFRNKNVCLVGSASSLLSGSNGEFIDSFDSVVRCNRGIIIKNEIAQGIRTDVWAIGQGKSVKDLIPLYDIPHVSLSHVQRSRKDIKHWMTSQMQFALRKRLGHRIPSTGLMIAWYIQHYNPLSLTLIGFDWKRTPTWYFEEGKYQPHNWKLEEAFMRSKIKCKIIDNNDLPK